MAPGDYHWVPLNLDEAGTTVPPCAVIAGYENQRPTHIARVFMGNQYEYCKLNAWRKFGYSLNGSEHEVSQGEVLVATGTHVPAWINGAYGEYVEGVVGEGDQSVGRVWYLNRWIPGKVVHSCHKLYFPYGGKERSSRHYQLLSTAMAWELKASRFLPLGAIPIDSSSPSSTELEDYVFCKEDPEISADNPKTMILCGATDKEYKWVVSGDGAYQRNAVACPKGHPIARAWMDRESCKWVVGHVTPQMGMFTEDISIYPPNVDRQLLFKDYQVLTACPSVDRKAAGRISGAVLLSLTIAAETVRSINADNVIAPEDLFMVTRLGSGEHPWTAVQEMLQDVEEDVARPRMSEGVREHLKPMSAIIQQLAQAEHKSVGVPPPTTAERCPSQSANGDVLPGDKAQEGNPSPCSDLKVDHLL